MELRDGDWRARQQLASGGGGVAQAKEDGGMEVVEAAEEEEEEEDGRLEGTAAYLSPELVQGVATRPTIASDCWAFGCTLYQSLCGRPPLWAETQQEVMRRIVKFDGLDEEKYPEGVTEEAKELIRSLLVVEVESRLGSGVDGIDEVRRHVFFEGAGVAVTAESGGNGGGGAGADHDERRGAL